METNYGTEEILVRKEGLVNCVIDTCDRKTTIESVEERSMDSGVMSTDDNDVISNGNGMEYGEDLVLVPKFRKHFGGCLELECDEVTVTVKSEHVENEADFVKIAELPNAEHVSEKNEFMVFDDGSKKHVSGNLKLPCDDKAELSQDTSVVNIVPILDHPSAVDTFKYDHDDDECQEINYSEGRNNPSKRIKLELVDHVDSSDDGRSPINGYDGNLKATGSDTFSSDLNNTPKSGEKSEDSETSSVGSRFAGLHIQRCLMCKKPFMTSLALKIHMKTKHAVVTSFEPKVVYSEKIPSKKTDISSLRGCPVCLVHFPEPLIKSKDFADHLKLHFPKLYLCRVCGQGFATKDNQQRHHEYHKDRNVHYCYVCGMHLKSRKNSKMCIQEHMQTHRIKQRGAPYVPEFLADLVKLDLKNDLLYVCNICGTAFKMPEQLLTHLASHSSEGQHSCFVCARECIWEADANIWQCKSHPDICNMCGLGNLRPETYDYHKKTHYGNFYNCTKCDQGFTQEKNLEKHISVTHHSLKSTRSCHICRAGTRCDVDTKAHMDLHRTSTFDNDLPDNFNAQMKRRSKRSGSWVCNICGFLSLKVQPLFSHLFEHIRKSYACPHCGKEYVSWADLAEHQQAKSHITISKSSCFVCNDQFLFKEELERHHETHFGAPHTCAFCEQQFLFSGNYVNHWQAVHHRKSRHPCTVCDVRFPFNDLKQHINEVHRGYANGIRDSANGVQGSANDVQGSANGVRSSTNGVPEDIASRIMTRTSETQSPLICSICGTEHTDVTSIVSHLQLHVNSELACPSCGREFTEQEHLTDHLVSYHTDHAQTKSDHPCDKTNRPCDKTSRPRDKTRSPCDKTKRPCDETDRPSGSNSHPVFAEHSYCKPDPDYPPLVVCRPKHKPQLDSKEDASELSFEATVD